MMYLIGVKPFENPKINYIEIFNESVVLIVSYHLFLFTDYIDGDELSTYVGYSIIGATLLTIAVNMVVMLLESLGKFKFICKKICEKYKKVKVQIQNRDYNKTLKAIDA